MMVRLILLMVVAVSLAGCTFRNVSSYRDSDGSLLYVGEVHNGDQPLSNPYVEGFFYDAQGNLIKAQRGGVCQVLPGKGVAAFEVWLPPEMPDPARVEWKLQGTPVDDVHLASGLKAEVTNTIVGPGGTTFVFGVMRNQSVNTYRSGYVCAAWVDAAGTVLRVDMDGSVSGLINSPGAVFPFSVQQRAIPPEAVGVKFYLDAGVRPPGTAPFTFKKLPSSAFVNASPVRVRPTSLGSLVTQMGEVRNDGTRIIVPYMFGTVNDSTGKIAGVSSGFEICDVSVAPGGTTFRSYSIGTPLQSPGAPTVLIEAEEAPPDFPLYTLAPTNVRYVGGGVLIQRITGTVRNTTGQTLDAVRVCGGAYDRNGVVIGYGGAYPDLPVGGLAPGASVSFTVELVVEGEVDEVKAVADGYAIE